MRNLIIKTGGTWPPIVFMEDGVHPMDLRGCTATYTLVPTDPRLKTRTRRLRPKDRARGAFHMPHLRTPGFVEFEVQLPNGMTQKSPTIGIVEDPRSRLGAALA